MQPFQKMIWYLNVLLQAGKFQEKYILYARRTKQVKYKDIVQLVNICLTFKYPRLIMFGNRNSWHLNFYSSCIMFYNIHFMEHENSLTAPEIFCFCRIYIRKLHLYRIIMNFVIIDTHIIWKSKVGFSILCYFIFSLMNGQHRPGHALGEKIK